MAKAKAEVEDKKGIKVGDEVNTPDGKGKVTAVRDDRIVVKLPNKIGSFRPRFISQE